MRRTCGVSRFCSIVFFFVFFPAAALAAEAGIGKVIALVPGAFVLRGGQTQTLSLHATLSVSDVVSTNATGRVKILFNDDSSVSLGPNTRAEMREYADSGSASAFNLQVPQGVVRAITGKIVDQNPDGFKITTPEATVGIRGTIVSLRTGDGVTTVFVENTLRRVYVNDVNVPSGQKITIPDNPIRVLPIQPEDRRFLGREMAFLGGVGVAAASPEPESGQALPERRLEAALPVGQVPPATPLADISLGNQRLGDSLVAATTGLVKGALASTGAFNGGTVIYADFSFNVNLSSGAISNAGMNSEVNMGSTSDAFHVGGGTGVLSGGTAVIGGFTGTAISDVYGTSTSFSVIPSDPTVMSVTSANVSAVGGSVSGTYQVNATSSGWSNVDSGTFSGARIQ